MTESDVLRDLQNYKGILQAKTRINASVNPEIALNAITEAVETMGAYLALGTVEELRLAKENQIPKKPNDEIKIVPILDENGAYVDADTYVYLLCPTCGNQVGIDDCVDNFCNNCGQAIDWSDTD